MAIQRRAGTDSLGGMISGAVSDAVEDDRPVIDLGEVPAQPAGESWSGGPGIGPQTRRTLWIGALVAMLILTTTASVRLPPGPLAVAAHVPFAADASLVVEGSHAVVIEDYDGQNRIRSYALPGGRPEWTEPIFGVAANATILATPTTVIASIPSHVSNGTVVEAFDLRSGRLAWNRVADAVELVSTGLLVFTQPGSATVITLVDPATGVAAWSTTVGPNCDMWAVADVPQTTPNGLLKFCPGSGEMSVLDLSTGRTRSSRNISSRSATQLLYSGSVILVGFGSGPRLSVTAFRTKDLARIWSGVSLPADGRPVACGPDLCLYGPGYNEVIVDPVTGRERADTGWQPSLAVSPTALLLVPNADHYASMRAGAVPTTDDPIDAGMGVTLTNSGQGSIWVATPTASSVRLLQWLHGVENFSCVSIAGWIACATSFNELTFWRQRS